MTQFPKGIVLEDETSFISGPHTPRGQLATETKWYGFSWDSKQGKLGDLVTSFICFNQCFGVHIQSGL